MRLSFLIIHTQPETFSLQFPMAAAHQLPPGFMTHPHPAAVQPGHPLTATHHPTQPSLNPLQPQPQFLPHHHPQIHVNN